ncbi:MAG: NigD-like N-terminal domain-containing protein [Bacteroidaceae bacterium]|nr:NigD-like N-terminal domain-containing protein [Bacteroidaceae bacterium]
MNNHRHTAHTLATMLTTMLVSMVCLMSCNDDEDTLPSYITSLVEVNTDAASNVKSIRTDDGNTYSIHQTISANTADTTYRCLATYTLATQGVTLYSISPVFSAHPKPIADYRSTPRDPVKFVSAWRTDRYVNLRIDILTTGADKHAYGFAYDGTTTAPDGKHTACFILLHRRPEADAESYTENVFLSIPLSHYTECDSFAVSITTYEGEKRIIL